MKNVYLALALLGFTLPSILVVIESVETGNILLYTHPLETMKAMFANRIATVFMIDLLFAVGVFFLWSYQESKKQGIKKLELIWVLTLLLGLAGGFPLFLYAREKALEEKKSN